VAIRRQLLGMKWSDTIRNGDVLRLVEENIGIKISTKSKEQK